MRKKKRQKTTEELLEAIKRLFILQLYRSGASTKEIGKILRISYKTVERILPKKPKKRTKKRK